LIKVGGDSSGTSNSHGQPDEIDENEDDDVESVDGETSVSVFNYPVVVAVMDDGESPLVLQIVINLPQFCTNIVVNVMSPRIIKISYNWSPNMLQFTDHTKDRLELSEFRKGLKDSRINSVDIPVCEITINLPKIVNFPQQAILGEYSGGRLLIKLQGVPTLYETGTSSSHLKALNSLPVQPPVPTAD
jgi:hypothetical protein